METKKPGNKKTIYGTLNRQVLHKLQDTFETNAILNAVGLLDTLGGRCEFSQDGIRNDFLRLHSMAHELFNGGTGAVLCRPGETIYELAEELLDDVSDWALALRQIQKMLEKLVALRPKDDSVNI